MRECKEGREKNRADRKLKMKDLKEEREGKSSNRDRNIFSGSLRVESWINILQCTE